MLGTPFLIKTYVIIVLFLESLSLQNPKFNVKNDTFWQYDHGDYHHMRALASINSWHSLQGDDVDIYALFLTNKISHIAKKCISNRVVTIRPSDPPWITTTINSSHFWSKFSKIRNKGYITDTILKSSFHKSIADKFKSGSISSRDWCPTLK